MTFSAPFNLGVLDVDALLGPVLKGLQRKSETGGRKPSATLSFDTAAEYGAALELYESRKWEQAQAAFEALAKKQPGFRLAKMRAAMAQSKQVVAR